MEEEMDRIHLKIEASIIACVIMILLCSCNLFATDKDKFYLDKDLNYTLSRIDIKKTGPDIVIPEKVGEFLRESPAVEASISMKGARMCFRMGKC